MATTKHTNESLQETFLLGLSGILSITGYKKTFFTKRLTIIPIWLAVLSLLTSIILELNVLKLIIEIKSLMIDFLPGILGFTIAGYSLMVGFIQSGMLDKITEPTSDSNFSLYQKMSSTFAINILLQAFALIIAFIVHFVNYIDINKGLKFPLSPLFVNIVNYVTLTILSYWFVLSVLMIIQIIVNIFGFSQLHHYFINKLKVDKDASSQDNSDKHNP
jgi:hypothetical protein